MKHHENQKIKAKEKVYEEERRKGSKAKLKIWRNQKRVSSLKKRSYWANAMAWLQQLAARHDRDTIYNIDMQR